MISPDDVIRLGPHTWYRGWVPSPNLGAHQTEVLQGLEVELFIFTD